MGKRLSKKKRKELLTKIFSIFVAIIMLGAMIIPIVLALVETL
jgi:ABC-type phosphate transport system permease subunit